jgi:diguanylate cyclase (GGDEF)-like protein
MIDLDDLKLINDSGGHEAGDVHLRAAGALIRGLFRDKDVVARIGGDEFAVLVPNTSKREALQMEERLRQALAQAQIRASVGSALRLAYDSMEEALAAADGAMYADKALRKAGRTSSAGLL